MAGTFIGVGVGPGDPELMTVKAINTIKNCGVIAFPGKDIKDAVAYNIAYPMVPEMADKVLLPLEMPMSADREQIDKAHNEAAAKIEAHLSQGKNVAFLVLGDVTIYSTFMYLEKIVLDHGFETEIVSGVTSFCAAAAAAGISLCQWDENLVIIPSRHQIPKQLELGKNYVLMKAGSRLVDIKERIRESGRDAVCVENCGMANEKVYVGVEQIPDRAGYYCLVFIK